MLHLPSISPIRVTMQDNDGARTQLASCRCEKPLAPVYDVLNGAIAAHAFPGCAFGVFADGGVVLQDALGRFTYDDDARAVTPRPYMTSPVSPRLWQPPPLPCCSISEGCWTWISPLGELLPGFVVGRSSAERARHVKLRHLLAHNSGLPGYVELFRTTATPAELLRACLQLPLEAEPGTRAEYSDPGFILLGQGAGGPDRRRPCHLGSQRDLSAARTCCHRVRPAAELRGHSFRPPKRTPRSVTAAFRARSRMRMPGCCRA